MNELLVSGLLSTTTYFAHPLSFQNALAIAVSPLYNKKESTFVHPYLLVLAQTNPCCISIFLLKDSINVLNVSLYSKKTCGLIPSDEDNTKLYKKDDRKNLCFTCYKQTSVGTIINKSVITIT